MFATLTATRTRIAHTAPIFDIFIENRNEVYEISTIICNKNTKLFLKLFTDIMKHKIVNNEQKLFLVNLLN